MACGIRPQIRLWVNCRLTWLPRSCPSGVHSGQEPSPPAHGISLCLAEMASPQRFLGNSLVAWSNLAITITLPWHIGLMFRTRQANGFLLRAFAGQLSTITLQVGVMGMGMERSPCLQGLLWWLQELHGRMEGVCLLPRVGSKIHTPCLGEYNCLPFLASPRPVMQRCAWVLAPRRMQGLDTAPGDLQQQDRADSFP